MPLKISEKFKVDEKDIKEILNNFSSSGELFGNGDRNKIKLFKLDGKTINVKSFKVPNLINKIAYKYFRKSKARRSFEYATILLEKGIGTPAPLAFFENFNFLGLKDSYYVSEHLVTELTYRELVEIPDFVEHDRILRQFTKFCFDLHEKGVEFLDHSPGNTLIKKIEENNYAFFLVDLNRMNFHNQMSFEQRMNNFRRLTPKKEMIAVMSNEYSKFYTEKNETEIFEKMWQATVDFQESFAKKKRLKKKLKFWKS
ncbi:Kdo domain containing protein [Flavobacterium sp. YJ01]|uniref:Kdo domain containing protein n=1 Tax=Flavobacterium sp. YJ01 TaxID=3031997 RepID=UPI0023E3DA3E|nr:Kdo domain containing protein [Flavobacterium sp. YJ01]WET03545.1 Kdo domain containing protein [Flavobacterium sp. YJ01]